MTPYIKSKKFNRKHNHGIFILNAVFCILIFSLLFFYLIQVNNLVGCSYEIRKSSEYFNGLKEKNEDLKMEMTQLRSPINLDEIVQSLGMVENNNIIYLGEEKTVALNK